MPWCPKCKNEYQEGITVCTDCGCGLVGSLENMEGLALYFGEEQQMLALQKYLESNGIRKIKVHYDETEQIYELLTQEEDYKKASSMLSVFIEQEENRKAQTEDNRVASQPVSVYQDSAEKAEDNRSSAWTLLIVGCGGLLVMALGMAGLLPFHLTGTNKYMVYGIMSALFLLFVVMGVISMKNSKIFAKRAESENSLRETLVKWCQDSLDPVEIDAQLHLSDKTSEEILYFKRFEKMKEKLNHQFMNLDQAFLEHFIDEQYDIVFSSTQMSKEADDK